MEDAYQTTDDGLFLVLSNFAILPAVIYTVYKHLFIDAAILVIMFIASSVYHLCQSDFFCAVSFNALQIVDHFFVYQTLIWVLFYIVNIPLVHRLTLLLFFQMGLLPFTLQYVNSWWLTGITLLLIGVVCVVSLTFFYWDKPVLSKFDFCIAVILIGTGFYLHVLAGPPGVPNYWLWHALWHMLAMLGIFFVYTFKTSGGIIKLLTPKGTTVPKTQFVINNNEKPSVHRKQVKRTNTVITSPESIPKNNTQNRSTPHELNTSQRDHVSIKINTKALQKLFTVQSKE